METIEEIRRKRLHLLKSELGSVAALAACIERSSSQVSQWLNASSDSKTGKPRTINSDSARYIEKKVGKASGWMDQPFPVSDVTPSAYSKAIPMAVESNVASFTAWPFTRIDADRFFALPKEERDVIEGMVIHAIQDAETRTRKRSASNGR
ncbi:MAG: hypothetical protein M0R29_05960 [Aquamicrobium sp.]|nr:hypothetical protein [Aquamicrobium sp.]